MRIIDIALYLFIFNLAIGITNNMINNFSELNLLSGVTKYQINIGNSENLVSETRAAGQSISATETSLEAVFSFFNTVWKGFIVVVPMIIDFIYNIALGIINFGNIMGISLIITVPIQLIVWIIYGIGFAQWISGRGFKEYM